MSSQVFYRKWRPQSLSEVAGQEQVTRTLLNALTSGRVSHAYLFCGPRGTGKTSTGRILAKAVNCLTTGGKGEPCNKCDICTSITEGRALDVIEVDAASNRRIDEIRELRQRVGYSPAQTRFKVYIIDEAHMLTPEASNALLKTLEEPPPHVIFVLATTEVHKLLPTIISRCQRFDFHRISQKDIAGRLAEISKSEGINIPPEGLNLISRAAQGSLRDAENVLEQIATYYGHDIELAQVQSVLGITEDARVKELLRHIVSGDVNAGIATIGSAGSSGLDLKQFARELVSYLRGLLLTKSGAQNIDFSPEDLSELKTLSGKTSLNQILRWLKTFGQVDFSGDSYTTLPLEIAFLDAVLGVEAEKPVQTADVKADKVVTSPAKAVRQPSEARPAANRIIYGAPKPDIEARTAEPAPAPVAPAAKKQPEKPPERPAPQPQKVAPAPTIEKEPAPLSDNGPLPLSAKTELERLKLSWRQIIAQAPLELRNTSAAAILRSAGVRPVAINENTVTLAFRFPVHKEKISAPESQKVAEKIISNFLGRSCRIQCTHEPEANHLVEEAQKIGGQITSVEDK